MRHATAVAVALFTLLLVSIEVESQVRILTDRYLSLTLGRKAQLSTLTTDPLLWRSTDSTIVTVQNSIIRGQRTGSAAVIVQRTSSSLSDTCFVTVVPWAAGITTLKMEPVFENLQLLAMRNDTFYLKGSGATYRWRSIYYSDAFGSPQLLADFLNDGTFSSDAEHVLPTPFGVFILAKRESQNSPRKIYRVYPGVPGATVVYGNFPTAPLSPNLSYTLQQGWDYDSHGNIYLGEYNVQSVSNYAIKVFKGSNQGASWGDVETFPMRSVTGNDGGVRHIHACQVDPYDGRVWISTGDDNAQSRIYYSDNQMTPDASGNAHPSLFAIGSQQYRTVSFAFTQGYIYWFMDAGCDSQKIFRVPRAASYPTLTASTPASMDYRQIVGVFKDKPFYCNTTIREGSTSTILVESVYEDIARYRCATPELDRRNRIIAIREYPDGSVQTQEVYAGQAHILYARMTPIGQDSRGYIYFNSSFCGDTNGVQIYRAQLHWNEADEAISVAGDAEITFPNSRIALEGSFVGGRRILVSRVQRLPAQASLPAGIQSQSSSEWQISADAESFFNGRISALRADLTDFGPGDTLVWLARANPGDPWINIGGVMLNGRLVSLQDCSGYSEFAVAVASSLSGLTITASSTSGGTIDPAGVVSVQPGETISFSIQPATGFQLDALAVDGNKVDSTVSYTFADVSESHTILAQFSPIRFRISAESGPHGTVSPGGDIGVNYGASVRCLFIPDPGYRVGYVLVDGVMVDSLTGYTFFNVMSDHALSVTYVPAPVSMMEWEVKDDFNGPAVSSINGRRKWVTFVPNEPGGAIQLNADSTISPANPILLARGGAAWDSLLGDGARMGIILKQKGGNSAPISCFSLYFRMNGIDLRTSTGYCLLYVDRPAAADLIYLMRATGGNSLTPLMSLAREIVAGDTLVVKVEQDKTMKACVYGANGVRDSITSVDNTYNPSQWYCWIRGVVLPTPVKLDDFMIGPVSVPLQAKAVVLDPERTETPERVFLRENYPNPFNPVTELRYELPVASRVRLKIFNVLGQELATLVDGIQAEGYKAVTWDATSFASGVYFYRLEVTSTLNAGETFTETKSMMLLK